MRNLVLLAPLLSLLACDGTSCTEMDCSSSVTIRFEGTLPDGSYTVELADPDLPPATCLVVMSGGQPEPAIDCELVVEWVDGALEATLERPPSELVVSLVSIGGDALVDEVLEPTYASVQPNGEDCPPTCQQALETVQLPSPS